MSEDRAYAIVFGRVVARQRERKGMSQTHLAKAALITQGTLSRIEAGRLRADVVTARRLSFALGLPYEALTARVEAAMERARSYAGRVTASPASTQGLDQIVAFAGAVGLVAIAMLAVGALFEEDEPKKRKPRRR